jgi:hypothetical protein
VIPTQIGWRRTSMAPLDVQIKVMFALKQRNTDVLERILWVISLKGQSAEK